MSGSRDATLRVWHIESGECLHVLVGHLAAVRCVQYDGRLVVSGAYDYMVKVWNPEREECLHTLQGHTNRVYSLQVRSLALPRLFCLFYTRLLIINNARKLIIVDNSVYLERFSTSSQDFRVRDL